ncbi:MAG: hypothetical protein EAZ76_12445 [Nostocales cyanobacterium]|nr:MAG: hypothetical protein EAZ87_15155 [Nostocales cyanobacterium]TAF13091.1 MAG: hypothetical protein EAZ76_12445 [Nostocales cyanobacterium]
MSQKDGFGSGFLLGTIVGGVVGGVLGTVLASRWENSAEDETISDSVAETKRSKRRQMRSAASEDIEMESARRSLEDKIAQLNATIDEVRDQLGSVNGTSPKKPENSLSQDS